MKLHPSLLLVTILSFQTFQAKSQEFTAEQAVIKSLESLQEKFIAIANDFPEDLYDSQPHPDSRSFIREIWHVSSGFGVLTARIKGQRPSVELINIPEDIKYDKTEIVNRLTKNTAECIELLQNQFDPKSIFALSHLSEHYGKIVTIYRVNNLVPPNSKD